MNKARLDGPLDGAFQVVVNRLDLQARQLNCRCIHHITHLHVRLETVRAEFSTDTAHLETAEWRTSVQQCVLVAPDGSGINGRGDAHGLTVVVGEDGSAETVRGVVCELDTLVFG